MTRIARATLLAVFISTSIPAVTGAQAPSVDSLLRRIDLLERTTSDLERRIRELEVLVRAEPSRTRAPSASANWRDLQNWRRLRRGMTMDEVRAVLGEPTKVDAFGAAFTVWRWGSLSGAQATFDGRSGKLDGWSEPDSESLSDDPERR